MPTVTRRFEFDYAHRVLMHESKCKFLHGHRAVLEVKIQTPELDSLGRVIDFGIIKDILGSWIDDKLDHNCLLNADDPLLRIAKEECFGFIPVFGRYDPWVMHCNPTAENIAKELMPIFQKLITEKYADAQVVHIRLYETPNCWADVPDASKP